MLKKSTLLSVSVFFLLFIGLSDYGYADHKPGHPPPGDGGGGGDELLDSEKNWNQPGLLFSKAMLRFAIQVSISEREA